MSKTYGHCVNCRQTFDSVCGVENLLTLYVIWQTYGHRVIRQQTFKIVCDVKNLRSLCVSSTDI